MILQSRSWAYCCCCCWVASFMSNSVQPHRRQPTRLPCPWDSPGKNTGVGCHFLLQCMQVTSESKVAQSYPTVCDPMDCSLSGSPVHGIFQARVMVWVAMSFSTWAYTQTKLKFKKIHASLSLQQHYWQQPRHGNKLNIHWQMHG